MAQPQKIDLSTPDLTQRNIERLAKLFPDAVTETKGGAGSPRH